MGQLKLDTAGNYMITEVKTSGFRINWIVVISVSFILLGLVIVYIVTKELLVLVKQMGVCCL